VELVDTRDLKSLAFTSVRVRFPSLVLKTLFAARKQGFFFIGVQHRVQVFIYDLPNPH
jgi:hypothetical protein